MPFQRATKHESRLRAALLGPAGSGKTFTALKIARALVGPEGRIALMDTEHGSASKYADLFQFDSAAPDSFAVEVYLQTIQEAEDAGYDALIIDSLSHAWAGKGGLLEFVDQQAKRSQSNNTFGAWREATPKHNQLIEAMLACRCHLIVTMRTKMEYVVDRDEKGKTTVRKVGMQPVQRDGLEYEFDVVADLDQDNNLIVTKTRCSALSGFVGHRVGEEVAAPLRAWLSGAPATEKPAPKHVLGAREVPKPRAAEPDPPHRNGKSEKRIGDMLERWQALCGEAFELNIDVAGLVGAINPREATEDEILSKGKKLRFVLDAAKKSKDDPFAAGDAAHEWDDTHQREKSTVSA